VLLETRSIHATSIHKHLTISEQAVGTITSTAHWAPALSPWNKSQSPLIMASWGQQPRLPVPTAGALSRGCAQGPADAQGKL